MTEGEAQLLAVRLEASLAKFEKQLKRGFDVAKKMSTDTEQRFANMERKTQKSAKASGAVIERELNKRRKGYENLMASIDPVFAATKRFKDGEKKLADALKVGEITAKEHARALRLLKAQYDTIKVSATTTGTAVRRSAMNFRGFGGIAQQAGYQVGDFAVQVGNGTSAVTAFAQQGSQLLGVFGPWGAVGGAALAILAPLTASILDLGDGSEESGKKVKTFADAMDVASMAMSDVDSATDLIADLEAIEEAYGSVTEEVLDLVRALALVARERATEKVTAALEKFSAENSSIASLEFILERQKDSLSKLSEEVSAYQALIDKGIEPRLNSQLLEAAQQRLRDVAARNVVEIQTEFKIDPDQASRLSELFGTLNLGIETQDISQQLVAIDELVELIRGLPSESPLQVLYRPILEAESGLRQARAQHERLNKVLGETGSIATVAEREFAKLVESYDRDTIRLKELADEREQVLRAKDVAMSEGDLEGVRQSERMLRAIDEEIDRLDDATERVEVMQSQIAKLQELLGYLRIDESGELADDLELMTGQLEGAATLGEQLDQVTLHALEGQFDRVISAAERLLRKVGLIKDDLSELKLPGASDFEAEYVARSVSGVGKNDEELVRAVLQVSEKLGIAAKDLLTAMSFETGGTFDPWEAGPTTQHGQHRGLIQWGEPQRERYGVTSGSTITEQVEAAGRYLQDSGVKAGDGLLRIYAAINAGHADRINASDAGNGGTPGTVLDKVNDQMGGHRARAEGLLRAYAGVSEEFRQALSEERKAEQEREREVERSVKLRKRELELRRGLIEASQQQLTDAEFESTLIGKSAAEQAKLRAEYMLTQDAKRRGIDLNEKLAGQEKTYADLIREQAEAIGQVVAAKEEQIRKNDDLAQQEAALRQLGDSIKDSLLDAVVAADSFEDALAGVVKMLARAAIEAALFNTGPFASGSGGGGLLGGIFSSIFGSAKGNVFSGGGHVAAYANGGVVGGPTYFPMKGGKTGLMGEAGPEAIMPLTRMSSGKLGVASSGQSSTAITFAPVIDARGADAGAVARMETAIKRAQAEFTPNVIKTVREAKKKRHL